MIITKEQVAAFCELSGDKNPIHTDPKYAAMSKFGCCIVPGTMMNAIIGGMIAERYPGAILIHQYLQFLAPVFIGAEFELIFFETDVNGRRSIIHITAAIKGRALVTSQSMISKAKI
jgi:acyl dehydratase